MVDVASRKKGAQVFLDAALDSLRESGLPIEENSLGFVTEFQDYDDFIIIMNVGGSWNGAVALILDKVACNDLSKSMYGRPAKNEGELAEALMEATNVATGRGIATLGAKSNGSVWISPPLYARGKSVKTRLHNTETMYFTFKIGSGRAAFVFAAAEKVV